MNNRNDVADDRLSALELMTISKEDLFQGLRLSSTQADELWNDLGLLRAICTARYMKKWDRNQVKAWVTEKVKPSKF